MLFLQFFFFFCYIEQKMGTLIKQRLNQHEKFVEEDEEFDEDDNDGALIFENTLYAFHYYSE